MQKGGYTYILTNKNHTTLYVGVTSNIYERTYKHKQHHYKNSFTDKYNIEILVYYESFDRIEEAISREKEIKKWIRQKKEELINSLNPEWKDLWEEISK